VNPHTDTPGLDDGRLESQVDLSVVCSIGPDVADLPNVHREFLRVLGATGRSLEFIYVLDRPQIADELLRAVDRSVPVRVFRMARGFGESAKLQYAFDRARGRYVLTIPDHFQVEPDDALGVLQALDGGHEVVVTRREPRRDAVLNRLQARVFHNLMRRLSRQQFHDLTCGLRGMSAEAARKLELYGDLYRFIPIIAATRGFRVTEIPARQRPENRALRLFGPGVYARRLLDILTVYFLTRFTKKPLRFFGLIGLSFGTLGLVITLVVTAQRLLAGQALANRPLLLLGILLIVVGVQLLSLGLLGEIITFLSTKRDAIEVSEVGRESEVVSVAASGSPGRQSENGKQPDPS
jgi:glycosyltransferase involved in cell wall biosynthesis